MNRSDAIVARQILQRTKTVCCDAFKYIASEDARREGFFRNAEPLTEKFPSLHAGQQLVRIDGICTPDGTGVLDPGDAIYLFNRHFSVNARIDYGDFRGEITPKRIYLEGIMHEGEMIRGFRFEFDPQITAFGILLRAQFDAREMSAEYFTHRSDKPDQERSLIDYDKINRPESERKRFGNRLVGDIYGDILRYHPENNYELARIALNLLAEFEAMLDSAIRHLS